MARCKECIHYDVCAKEGRMVQIDSHTWDDYNRLDDVEMFCDNYILAADVAPKSEVEKLEAEVAREIIEYLENNGLLNMTPQGIAELKKKYTEDKG